MPDVITKRVVGSRDDIFYRLLKYLGENGFIVITVDIEAYCIYFKNRWSFLKTQFYFKLYVYQVQETLCDVVFYYESNTFSSDSGFVIPEKIVNKIVDDIYTTSNKFKSEKVNFNEFEDYHAKRIPISYKEIFMIAFLILLVIYYFLNKSQ